MSAKSFKRHKASQRQPSLLTCLNQPITKRMALWCLQPYMWHLLTALVSYDHTELASHVVSQSNPGSKISGQMSCKQVSRTQGLCDQTAYSRYEPAFTAIQAYSHCSLDSMQRPGSPTADACIVCCDKHSMIHESSKKRRTSPTLPPSPQVQP